MKKTPWRNVRTVLWALALCLLAVLFTCPVKAQAATKAKVILEFSDGTTKTWETGDAKIELGKKELAYIYFGEYPQTEITGANLTTAIKNATYDSDGIAMVNGVRYKRMTRADANYWDSPSGYFNWREKDYAYFKMESIKWRVLQRKNKTALLLSEYVIDNGRYNTNDKNVTWAKSPLRAWLNDEFISAAFNTKEQKLIKKTTLTNSNPYYKSKGGADTKDKVYLLSIDDMINTSYGFSDNPYKNEVNRRGSSTDYAWAMGNRTLTFYTTEEGNYSNWWWLRSPGENNRFAAIVGYEGSVVTAGSFTDTYNLGVRPAIRLNLKSVIK